MSDSAIGFEYLVGMFGVVASAAVFPVAPTGAAVSVGASLAEHNVGLIALVVLFGAAGAYVSDIATYAALRYASDRAGEGSGRLGRWLARQRKGKALGRVDAQVSAHPLRTFLLSRLIPAGRLPVLLAAALGGYPLRRYALVDLGAATLWSLLYTAIGLLGRAVFPKQWEGAAAGIGLVILFSLGGALWSRWRRPKVEVAE
ncbi:VTT domain-containing protein [Acidothermaceae bacterium B102]|nr:VTT domain-containing protein [Acidothermaceae bacterium B102]